MTVVIFMAFFLIVLVLIVQFLFCFLHSPRENQRINSEKWCEEFKTYFKHYSLFN